MKHELLKRARLHASMGKQRAADVVTILRGFRKDLETHESLRSAVAPILRELRYHRRQAALLEDLAARAALCIPTLSDVLEDGGGVPGSDDHHATESK